MRVAMIVWNTYRPDRRVHNESRGLLELGHQVTVVALAGEGRPASEVLDDVPVRRLDVGTGDLRQSFLSPLFYSSSARRAAKAIEGMGFDRLHAHDLDGLYVAKLVARKTGIPVVWDAHEADYGSLMAKERGPIPRPIKYRYTNAFERRIVDVAESIVVNNPYNTSKDHFGKPVHVVPFRSDPRWYTPAPMSARDDPPLAVYIGAIQEHKGAYLMLDAWRLLRERGREVRLEVAGRVSPKVPIEEAILSRGLDGLVGFHEWMPYQDLPKRLLHRASLAFSLHDPQVESYQMTLPNKLMDYLACGVPVVASAIPSQRDLMADYDCGALVDRLTPEAVADGVEAVLDKEPSYTRSEALRATKERFPWSGIRDALNAIHPTV